MTDYQLTRRVDKLEREQRERAEPPGCFLTLLVLFSLFVVVYVVLGAIHWTSVQNGCVIERQFQWETPTDLGSKIVAVACIPRTVPLSPASGPS